MQSEKPTLVDVTVAPASDVQKFEFFTLLVSLVVYLFRFTASAFSKVAEILERNTSATHRARVQCSPLTFRHAKDAVNLQQTSFFVALLSDIRHHLLLSKPTRSVYVSYAEQFFNTLSADIQNDFINPTDDDFYKFVVYHWPTFSSFIGPASNELTWGSVEENRDFEPNQVNVLSTIIESAKSATTACNPDRLPLDLYKLVITVVILHELSHAFTKFYFNETINNLSGIDAKNEHSAYTGESTWLLEEKMMGGRLAVEWKDKSKFGEMDAIDRVVLINDSGSWIVDLDMATKVISSLQTATFNWPAKTALEPHVRASDSVQAKVTETTDNPVLATKTSQWFNYEPLAGPVISFIGYDRKV